MTTCVLLAVSLALFSLSAWGMATRTASNGRDWTVLAWPLGGICLAAAMCTAGLPLPVALFWSTLVFFGVPAIIEASRL